MENLKQLAQTLRQTADEARKWKEIKQNLFQPELTDTTMIPIIYKWVEELYAKNEDINTFKYDPKHYFLICVMFLYSPRTMVGENMNDGIRDVVSQVLSISESHVSNSCATVRDWFYIYRDFEQSLTYLYSEILNRLKEYE